MKKDMSSRRGAALLVTFGMERFPKVGASLLVLSTNFRRYLVLLRLVRSPLGFILHVP